MVEKIPNQPRSKKLVRWVRDAATVFGISLALISCDETTQDLYQRQLEKVQQLEHKLLKQRENYYNVSRQWEIQEDLKKNWADPTINQEIWYAIQLTEDQDQEIERTKKELEEAQRELARMKEEIDFVGSKNTVEYNKKPNPDKYDYILEEFKRSREAQ